MGKKEGRDSPKGEKGCGREEEKTRAGVRAATVDFLENERGKGRNIKRKTVQGGKRA